LSAKFIISANAFLGSTLSSKISLIIFESVCPETFVSISFQQCLSYSLLNSLAAASSLILVESGSPNCKSASVYATACFLGFNQLIVTGCNLGVSNSPGPGFSLSLHV